MAPTTELYAQVAEYLADYRHGKVGTTKDRVFLDVKIDLQHEPALHHVLLIIKECMETIEVADQKTLVAADIIMPEVADLARQAVKTPVFGFDHVREYIGLDRLQLALQSPAETIVHLALDCLEKATKKLSDANIVGGKMGLVEHITLVWLSFSDTAVSTHAGDLLLSLLRIELKLSPKAMTGNATRLVERRLFQDPAAYRLLFRYTSDVKFDQRKNPEKSSWLECPLNRTRRSIAQGRLFEFVTKLIEISFVLAAQSQIPEIERAFRRQDRPSVPSLLDYTTHDMVDPDDPLVGRVRMDFCKSLLEVMPSTEPFQASSITVSDSSQGLTDGLGFLVQCGIHNDILKSYIDPGSQVKDAIAAALLESADVYYIATYYRNHPSHALEPKDKDTHHQILRQIFSKLDALSFSKWTIQEGQAPLDVDILKEMPLSMLIQELGKAAVQLIPVNPPNPVALRALARIFHGPNQTSTISNSLLKDGTSLPMGRQLEAKRAAGSRALFYEYVSKHSDFWANLAAAIVVLTVPSATKQAIDLAWSIACARWTELPDEPLKQDTWPMPTESRLISSSRLHPLKSGMATLLTYGPEVWEALLMRVEIPRVAPAADASSTVYDVQVMKQNVLASILEEMQKGTGRGECSEQLWRTSFLALEQTLKAWRAGPRRGNMEVQTMEL